MTADAGPSARGADSRRRLTEPAARRLARLGGTAGQPRGHRRRRTWVARADPPRRRAAARRGGRSGAGRADHRRRGRQRLPDRRAGRAVAPHDRGVRGLPAAARAEGAAVRRVRVVLPDGHADDPRRRDVDGALPRQAHHAARPAAGRGRAGDRRRPPRPSRRAARRADEFGALVEAFNSMAEELASSRRDLERSRHRSRTQASRRAKGGAATSRRSSSASRRASSRSTSGRDQHGERRGRRGCSGIGAEAVGRQATEVFAREDLAPLATLLRSAARARRDSPPQEITLTRDGRDLHLAAVATALAGDGGSSKAPSSCSTT